MSAIETHQVRLKLTDLQFVLDALRRKKRLVPDPESPKDWVFNIQFDSHTFSFKKGKVITVGGNVADALVRDAFVIIGDDLTGDVTPVLEEVGRFDLAYGEPEEKPSKTVCPVCNEDQGTLRALIEHVAEHETEKLEDDAPNRGRRIPVPARRAAAAGARKPPSIDAPPPDTFDEPEDANDSTESVPHADAE